MFLPTLFFSPIPLYLNTISSVDTHKPSKKMPKENRDICLAFLFSLKEGNLWFYTASILSYFLLSFEGQWGFTKFIYMVTAENRNRNRIINYVASFTKFYGSSFKLDLEFLNIVHHENFIYPNGRNNFCVTLTVG